MRKWVREYLKLVSKRLKRTKHRVELKTTPTGLPLIVYHSEDFDTVMDAIMSVGIPENGVCLEDEHGIVGCLSLYPLEPEDIFGEV